MFRFFLQLAKQLASSGSRPIAGKREGCSSNRAGVSRRKGVPGSRYLHKIAMLVYVKSWYSLER